MRKQSNAIFCLLAVLLSVAVFFGLFAINLTTRTFAPDDPGLAAAAAEGLVFLDLGSAVEEAGLLRYELILPEPEGLYVFQPKANGARLTVNGMEAESFGLREQNLFMLSRLSPEGGVYQLEITGWGGGNLNNLSVFIGTLSEVISCQSTLFFSRFIALGVNIIVGILSLTLFLKKRSETYLATLALFAFTRTLSSLYFTIAHALERISPALSALYMIVYHSSFGQWFSFFVYALLQFLVLRSFAPARRGRLSLFVPIALGSLPMLFFPVPTLTFQTLRLLASCVAMVCYLISLYDMDRKDGFRIAVLSAALALSTGSLFFVHFSQTNPLAYGVVNFRAHISIMQTCIYPAAYLLIACDKFAGKFREADMLNAELEERIQESTRQHTLFIRSTLHNLKTPLFSLSGYSDMAAASVKTDPDRCESYIAKVKENSVYVGHLLDQLFLLTQMDAGQVEFQKINVDLTDLLSSVCDTTQLTARKKNIRVIPDVQRELFVYGDALYLRQALQNIADNAVIHTPEGGSISIASKAVANGCQVTISDTGCGIAQEDLPKIFDRYYSNRHGGRSSSGLGLTISKMLIEANGGSISAASREGEGARFTIVLPGPREE